MEQDEIMVLNPKRRRKSTRRRAARRTTRRRVRRNPPFMALAGNPHRRRTSRRRGVVVHRRSARRNPGGSMFGGAINTLKDGAMGTVGILVNNAIGNTTSDMLKLTDPTMRQLVKVGTAVLAPTLLRMVSPGLGAQAAKLSSYAIAHEGAKIVEQKVLAGMGSIGKTFSSSDTPGTLFNSAATPASDTVKGMGYVANQRTIGPGGGYFGGVGYVANQRVIGPTTVTPFFAQQTGIR